MAGEHGEVQAGDSSGLSAGDGHAAPIGDELVGWRCACAPAAQVVGGFEQVVGGVGRPVVLNGYQGEAVFYEVVGGADRSGVGGGVDEGAVGAAGCGERLKVYGCG